MQTGGSGKVNISKPGAGFAKSQTGGSNIGSMIFGMPNSGMTGPNRNSVTETMKKGGSFAPNRSVQSSCKGGMVRDENGRCVMARKMKEGGIAKKVTTKLVKAKSGMSLKKVPSGKVGLAKLPTAVRNKMGYMKKGGPRKSLKRYQEEGEVMESAPSSTPAPAPVSASTPPRTLANAIQDNVKLGMSMNRAISLAKKEFGLKKAVDPNTLINAIGSAATAVGSTVNAFKPQPMGFNKKGGASKFVSKKPAMRKGGVARKVMVKSKKK
jgi:hypothetical protein